MAGLTTTQTFSDGDTVTAAKLNNIISIVRLMTMPSSRQRSMTVM